MKNCLPDRVVIGPGIYIFLATMLLLLPPVWIFSVFLAALVHELFHWAAVCLCGGRVLQITVDAGGIRMDIAPLPPGRELICALAGPLGSGVLACFVHRMPVVGLCALVQGIFNLLPVYPLDGGRAVRSMLMMFLPTERAERLSHVAGGVLLLCMLFLGVWCMLRFSTGILPVLFPLLLCLKSMADRGADKVMFFKS